MAKIKAREAKILRTLEKIETGYGKKYTFSSGVTAVILPFPALRYETLNEISLDKFPEPVPPKKKVRTVDGEETADDVMNPDYIKLRTETTAKRESFLAEKLLRAALRYCVELDLDPYEEIISLIEIEDEKTYPTMEILRREEFFKDYVIRSSGDFQALTQIAIGLMGITQEDVEKRVETFRGDVERSADNENGSSGAT